MTRKIYISVFSLLLLSGCAQKGPPPGGPVDKTAPSVIRTYPEQRAVNVSPDQAVEIEFSEAVQPGALSQSVFITPFPEENAAIRLRGRLLTIRFRKPLADNATCVITLGTGIKDYRGNPMERSYSLAFSTGPRLDEGSLGGRVWGEKDATGINIWAYRCDSLHSPDPSRQEPDYSVQCGRNGDFTLSYLAPGTYRLFAVKDRAADRLYQPVEDQIGLTTKDAVVLPDSTPAESLFLFRLTTADTAGPVPVKAEAVDAGCLRVIFNEAISLAGGIPRDSLRITAAGDIGSLVLRDYWVDLLDERTLHIPVESPLRDQEYALLLPGIQDKNGNMIADSLTVVRFSGSAAPDTTGPRITRITPAPGSLLADPGEAVRILFSEAVDSALFRKGPLFSDTAGAPPAGSVWMPHPMEIGFLPAAPLPGGMRLVCSITGDLVRDRQGNPAADSTITWTVANPDTFSSMSGVLTDADSGAAGAIFLRATQLSAAVREYKLMIPGPGPYRFEHLLPGLYIIEGFRDQDGNGSYSYGSVLPWTPAERFFVHPDTVKIRSRWPNEGNDLIIN
ncbi:Ig-like domain-containing protein [bacterium]|nr:Ig-like domain-containing protein [bacterium]